MPRGRHVRDDLIEDRRTCGNLSRDKGSFDKAKTALFVGACTMSEICGLGYIGVEVGDVAAYEAFATELL